MHFITRLMCAAVLCLGMALAKASAWNLPIGPQHLIGTTWNAAGLAGDVDRDGDPDLLASAYKSSLYNTLPDVAWWENRWPARLDAAKTPSRLALVGPTNLAEYIADTIPTNGISVWKLSGLSNAPPAQIIFSGSVQRVYTLQVASDLANGPWLDLPGQVGIPGAGAGSLLQDNQPDSNRYYRVRVNLP